MLRSEIARRAGCGVEIVRYYEKAGLLAAPGREANGYRRYEPRHLEQLAFIRTARELGFGLEEIRALMALSYRKGESCQSADRLVQAHLRQIDEKIAQLGKLRKVLQTMLENCPGEAVADCKVFGALGQAARQRSNEQGRLGYPKEGLAPEKSKR